MGNYTAPILTAVLVFPVLAAVITLPYMLVQYKRFGAIPRLRTLIVYSFALYMMTTYFLVILPLPDREEVAAMTGSRTQLIPFQFVRDFIRESSFDLSKPSTWIGALKEGVFLQPFCNLLMFVPLGIYLRYYFRLGLKKTVLFSFLWSLFFELTQLTGLYGIYPRSYRLFDVDDLMVNTLGGVCGYFAAALCMKLLPSRKEIDEQAVRLSDRVTLPRRLTAVLVDWFVIGGAVSIASAFGLWLLQGDALHTGVLSYLLIIFCYFVLLPLRTGGYTIGKRLVNIRLVREDGRTPELKDYLIRYGILYGVIVPAPSYFLILFGLLASFGGIGALAGIILLMAVGIWLLAFCLRMCLAMFRHRSEFWYERVSHVRNRNALGEKMSVEFPLRGKMTPARESGRYAHRKA